MLSAEPDMVEAVDDCGRVFAVHGAGGGQCGLPPANDAAAL